MLDLRKKSLQKEKPPKEMSEYLSQQLEKSTLAQSLEQQEVREGPIGESMEVSEDEYLLPPTHIAVNQNSYLLPRRGNGWLLLVV